MCLSDAREQDTGSCSGSCSDSCSDSRSDSYLDQCGSHIADLLPLRHDAGAASPRFGDSPYRRYASVLKKNPSVRRMK